MTIRVERDRIANAPAETTEEVKITPKLVSAGERETTIMAKAIYEAFYETRNDGIVSGEPAPLESTLIDGSFYLRRIARRVLRKVKMVKGQQLEIPPNINP